MFGAQRGGMARTSDLPMPVPKQQLAAQPS